MKIKLDQDSSGRWFADFQEEKSGARGETILQCVEDIFAKKSPRHLACSKAGGRGNQQGRAIETTLTHMMALAGKHRQG